jgi:hypothetical protein
MGVTSSECSCCSSESDNSSTNTNQTAAIAERSVTKLLAVFKALEHENGRSNGYTVGDIVNYMRENLGATGDVESEVTTALNNALSQGLILRRYGRHIFVGPIANKMTCSVRKQEAGTPRSRPRRSVRAQRNANCESRQSNSEGRSRTPHRHVKSNNETPSHKEGWACRCYTRKGQIIQCNYK